MRTHHAGSYKLYTQVQVASVLHAGAGSSVSAHAPPPQLQRPRPASRPRRRHRAPGPPRPAPPRPSSRYNKNDYVTPDYDYVTSTTRPHHDRYPVTCVLITPCALELGREWPSSTSQAAGCGPASAPRQAQGYSKLTPVVSAVSAPVRKRWMPTASLYISSLELALALALSA